MAVWSTPTFQSIVDSGRIDADHYKPEYLTLTSSLFWTEPLGNYIKKIIHPAEFQRRYSENGWKVIRTQNVRSLRMDFDSNEVFLPHNIAVKLSRNHLRQNDILITRTGANFGQCSLFFGEDTLSLATSHTFILRTNDKIDSAYLALFLNSIQGRLLLNRGMYGSSQPEIAPKYILRVPVPKFTNTIESDLAESVRFAYILRKQSVDLYLQAQKLLESELGLDKFRFDKPVGYTAKFSEFESSRRLDPEHFYPTFKSLCGQLPKSISLKPLSRFSPSLNTGIQPKYRKSGECEVINSKHIGINKIDLTTCRRASAALLRDMATNGDILLNATGRGTLGRCAVLTSDEPKIYDVCIIRIRPSGIDPFFLSALLNSRFGQLQMELHTRGTSGQLPFTHAMQERYKSGMLPHPFRTPSAS